MMNSKREIIDSIPSKCKNYKPGKEKSENVRCSKLGKLYKCLNYKGKIEGCIFCKNFKT